MMRKHRKRCRACIARMVEKEVAKRLQQQKRQQPKEYDYKELMKGYICTLDNPLPPKDLAIKALIQEHSRDLFHLLSIPPDCPEELEQEAARLREKFDLDWERIKNDYSIRNSGTSTGGEPV